MKIQDSLQDIECIMKVKSKDDVILMLIDKIKLRHANMAVPHLEAYADGWVTALEWVLSIDKDDDST